MFINQRLQFYKIHNKNNSIEKRSLKYH